ncbi:hypothetical protein K431DRAFT_315353 [Polychaeton citri CBS 116435]|uniref:Uncharacterized protein n=1 Tax=Polychaeton citri CBS 116435 TaxID=1314669 RepID=A0A9P4PZN8_9PEZI|nr:hypothetical protein K431DRAFT_315353 [Polychaeton citri CBS 116435]
MAYENDCPPGHRHSVSSLPFGTCISNWPILVSSLIPDAHMSGCVKDRDKFVADSINSSPDAAIPSSYYVCAPRWSSSSNDGTRSYPRQQIQQVINTAFLLEIEGVATTAANGRQYPQRFYVRGPNAANFNIPNHRQVDSNRLVEFPIIRNDDGQYVPFLDGGNQGPDRVVFDGTTGYFAGVFTHRGEVNNNFHQALGHDQDVNDPVVPPPLPPTILDVNPISWFSGMSGDRFPMKRTPTYPPADFSMTTDGCPSTDGQCYCYNTITAAGWYPRNAALQAIGQACSDWSGQTVPITNSQTDIQTLSATKQITYDDAVWSIEMSVWQTLLVNADASTVDQQSCVTALTSALDNCQTDTADKKIGGEYILHIGGVGSQQYVIHPSDSNTIPSDDSEPFNT